MPFQKFITKFLQSNIFELYKQPIVPVVSQVDYKHLMSSTPIQYEILLRAVQTDNTRISAYEMIQQAEVYGWSEYIDDEILQRSVSHILQNHTLTNNNVLYHINLSGGTINRLGVDALEKVVLRLEQSEINHNQLCFEITETVSIENMDKVKIITDGLKIIGCKIALDDFGDSLISFETLRQIQPDYLKIAGRYVLNATTDKYYEHLIGSIANLCSYIGVQTIAEHVETKETYELMYELDVNYSQGWYTGIPVPLQTVTLLPSRTNYKSLGTEPDFNLHQGLFSSPMDRLLPSSDTDISDIESE